MLKGCILKLLVKTVRLCLLELIRIAVKDRTMEDKADILVVHL